jgi:hypothetical protein
MKIPLKASIMLTSFAATALTGAVAKAYQWVPTGGPHARHVASGWMISTEDRGNGNYSIYRYSGGHWGIVSGVADRDITVDQSGNAWVINSYNDIYRWNGSSFVGFALGSNNWNTVAVGNPHNQYEIWATDVYNNIFDYSGTVDGAGQWVALSGSATKVAIFNETEGCTGRTVHVPFVVNGAGYIYKYNYTSPPQCSTAFQQVAGSAFDITTEFVTGADSGLYQWNQGAGGFYWTIGSVPDPNNNGTAGIGSGANGTFAMNSQGTVYILQ